MQKRFFPVVTMASEFERRAAAYVLLKITVAAAARPRGAVKVARPIHDKRGIRKCAVAVSTDKTIEGAIVVAAGDWRKLKHYTEVMLTSVTCSSVQIAGSVHQQRSLRIRSIFLIEAVEHGFTPYTGVVGQFKDHPAASGARSARASRVSRAVKIA